MTSRPEPVFVPPVPPNMEHAKNPKNWFQTGPAHIPCTDCGMPETFYVNDQHGLRFGCYRCHASWWA